MPLGCRTPGGVRWQLLTPDRIRGPGTYRVRWLRAREVAHSPGRTAASPVCVLRDTSSAPFRAIRPVLGPWVVPNRLCAECVDLREDTLSGLVQRERADREDLVHS